MELPIIITTIAISGIISSLRYHALSQNNNYILPLSIRLLFYFSLQLLLFFVNLAALLLLNKTILLIIALSTLIANTITNLTYKTKYKFTNRGKVTFVLCNVIYIAAILLAYICKDYKIRILTSLLLTIFYPAIMCLTMCFINKYFVKKNRLFVAKATEKLSNMNIIKIGITGSYGKTSCKNILQNMLSNKYKVYASKENYNTPMGLSICINELTDEEVFIAEMGARKKGDIAELTNIIKPNYGIITGVTNQHLKTFKSLHNIYTEKYCLAKALEDNGLCVFNGNDKYTLKMYKEFSGNKLKVGLNKFGDVQIDNVEMNSKGSFFSLQIKDQIYFCNTKLLGRHNILNIAMCVALATELGVGINQIMETIRNLKPVNHRLEYLYSNGIHILDDSYNSNIVGVKSALECLSFFPQRKIVLAQGLVEMGKQQKSMNYEIGCMLAKTADAVILTGRNKNSINKGLIDSGYVGEIFVFPTLKKAQKNFKHILRNNDVLLLQNDLPDVF